jgi:hypothetical protein
VTKSYVMSGSGDLYSFDTSATTFTKVGTLNCPADPSAAPTAMTVDGAGSAFVEYTDGTLFKASTTNAACAGTGFAQNQHGFVNFGLGFAGGRLYASGISSAWMGLGLAAIDPTTFLLSPIADYPGSLATQVADLASTSDGTLYGLFATGPAVIASIDPSTAATSHLFNLPATIDVFDATDTALLADASGFWIFVANTNANPVATSSLVRVQGGATRTVSPEVGFVVDGAGSYTACMR